MKRALFLAFLALNLKYPFLVSAHFGINGDQTVIAGAMVDKTLVLGALILGFIVLTVIFQLLRRKRV